MWRGSLALLVVGLVKPATGFAAGDASLYKSKDILVVQFFVPTGDGTDDKDPLKKQVEISGGPVECDPNKVKSDDDKQKGWLCSLGIKRDGTAARAGDMKKAMRLPHLAATFSSVDTKGKLEVTISGAAAEGIELWLDCVDKHGKGVFACDPTSEKDQSAVRFLLADGAVKAATKR